MEEVCPVSSVARKVTRVVVMAAAGLALVYAGVSAYVAIDGRPSTCAACHSMEPYFEAMREAAHQDQVCSDCHGAGGGVGGRLEFASVVAGRMIPRVFADTTGEYLAVTTSDRACLGCHESLVMGGVVGSSLRIDHSTCAVSAPECVSCHTASLHETGSTWPRDAVMGECISCHRDEGAPNGCETCHTGRRLADRVSSGPWQVTHGAEWRQTHGMGDLDTCDACHESSDCVGCHGVALPHPVSFSREHGEFALLETARCSSCHDADIFCDDCHGVPMPHDDDFIVMHSTVAAGTGDPLCARCHVASDCDECHVKHVHPGGAIAPGATDGGD